MLEGYNKHLRPVKNIRTPTLLNMSLHINHIDSLNQKDGTVSLHGWMALGWVDQFLRWAPDSSSPARILLPQYYIWKPGTKNKD